MKDKWIQFHQLLEVAVNCLASLVECKLSYSAICTARSALSCYLKPFDGLPFGSCALVKRFMKGVFEVNPSLPKWHTTWDVNTVLELLETWAPVEKLTLKEITMKLCMLIAPLSGQRCQTLRALNVKSMDVQEDKCTFYVNTLLKHSRRGAHQAPIELHAFSANKNVCVVTTLKEYLRRAIKQSQRQSERENEPVYNTTGTPQTCQQRYYFQMDKIHTCHSRH